MAVPQGSGVVAPLAPAHARLPDEPGAQDGQWWQFGEVLAHANRLRVELKQLHLLGVGRRAQDESDRGFFACGAFLLVQPAQVQLHLSDVGGFEGFEFQLDCDEAVKVAAEEEKVEMKIVLPNADALLPRDEREAFAQLEQHAFEIAEDRAFEVALAERTLQAEQIEQVGIAEHDVRTHLSIA